MRIRLSAVVERSYLRSVDAVVCNSETTRSAVADLLDRDRRDLGGIESVVAPPAGDRFDPDVGPEWIDERAHESGPLRVVFVGTLVPRKGLETLVRGLARRPPVEWTLTVVGDPTADPAYARRVRHLVADLNCRDRVAFVGRLPDEALAARLRRHHLLAVPSTYEGFGIVYLEGMGFGLPAVASAAGGASEVVTDGETGFLVDPGDVRAVADAVGTLAGDRDRLAEMGRAALARYAVHPTWDETASEVERFLRDLVPGDDST